MPADLVKGSDEQLPRGRHRLTPGAIVENQRLIEVMAAGSRAVSERDQTISALAALVGEDVMADLMPAQSPTA